MIPKSRYSKLFFFVTFIFMMLAPFFLSGQVVIFDEDFDSYADGTTAGTDWDANIFGNCDGDISNGTDFFWGVFSGAFTISDADGINCCDLNGNPGGNFGDNGNTLEIGPIDISPYSSFTIDFDFNTVGNFECSFTDFPPIEACPEEDAVPFCQGGHDQAIFSYSIDGGPDVVFGYWCGDMFCYGAPFLCGNVTGSNLSIKVTAGTQSDSEEYTIDNIVVTGYTDPLIIPTANTEVDSTTVCEDASLSLDEIGGWASTWTWTSPSGSIFNTQTVDIPTIQSNDEGWWRVEASDGSGCNITDSIFVEIEAAPSFTVISDITVCEGLTVDLDTIVDPSNNNLTYTFHSGNPPTSANQIPQPTSFNNNTTIFVLGTSSNGCTAVEAVNVEVIAIPVAPPISASDDTVCVGDDFQLFSDIPIPIPGLQFNWTGPNGFSSTSEDPQVMNATVDNSGTYQLVVSLLGCSSLPSTVEVIVVEGADQPTVTSPLDICLGEPLSLQAQSNPNASYSWNGPNGFTSNEQNPLVTSSAQFSDAGTYTVTASVGGCAGNSSDVEVNILDTPSFDLIILDEVACSGDANGAISVAVNSGPAPFTYDWNDDTFDGLSTIIGVPAGTYTLNLIDDNGCSLEKSVVLEDPDPLIILCFGAQDVSSPGGTDGLFNVDIQGGTPNYTITYDNNQGTAGSVPNAPQGTNTIMDLPAGTYNVTVTDDNGCTDECTITINEAGCDLQIDSISIVAEILCFGDSTGSLVAWVSGGSGNYTYEWTLGGAIVGTEISLADIPAGDYILEVEDSDNPGCTQVLAISLSQPELLEMLDCQEIQPVSSSGASDGEALISFQGGTLPYSISWQGAQSGSTSTSEDSLELTNLSAGSYTFILTDANGCLDSCTLNIQDGGCDLSIAVDTAFFTSCPDDSSLSIDLDIFNNTPHTILIWNGDTVNTSSRQNLPKGIYNIRAIDTLSNCTDLLTIDMSYPSMEFDCVVFQENSAPGVSDGIGGLIIDTIAFPYTAEIIGGDFPVVFSGISTDTLRVASLEPGTYQIIITDSLGCVDSCNFTLADPGCELALELDTAYFDSCPADSSGVIGLNTTGASGTVQYIWGEDTLLVAIRSNLGAGNYRIIAFDENNCRDTIDVDLIYEDTLDFECAVFSLPSATGAANGSGGLVINRAAFPATVNIDGVDFSTSITDQREDSIFFNQLDSGWYTITITDSLGCSDTCRFFMPDGGCPIFSLDSIVRTPIDCNDPFSGALEAFVTGGSGNYFYDWSVDSLDGQNPISGLISGTYNLTVTDIDLGCVVTGNQILFPPNQVSLSYTVTSEFCAGDSVQLDLQASGGVAPFEIRLGSRSFLMNGRDSSLILTEPGNYTLEITDRNGCFDEGDFTLTELNPGRIAINESICAGESITIAGVIFNAANTTDTIVLPGQAINGCDSIIAVNIDVEEVELDFSLLPPDCQGAPVTQVQINNISGAGLFQVNIGGMLYDITSIPTTITDLQEGSSSIFALSSNNCSSDTIPIELEEAKLPIVTVAQVNPIQEGDTVLLEGFVEDADISELLWSPGNSLSCDSCLSTAAFPTSTTTYLLTVTSDEGCEGLAQVTVIVNDRTRSYYIPNVFSPNGDGINDFFTLYSDGNIQIRRMLIFNRWGDKVFESGAIAANDENSGWDGTFRNKELSEGVYVYSIEIIDQDGNMDILKGSITLIR